MVTPTFNQARALVSQGGGVATETLMERILTMLAVQASGQNPDLTTWPGPVPSGTYAGLPKGGPTTTTTAVIPGWETRRAHAPADINTNTALFDDGKYNRYGILDVHPDGTLVYLYRAAPGRESTAGVYGTINMVKSTDGGKHWSAPVVVFAEANVDLNSGAFGITPTGRLVLVYNRQQPSPLQTLSIVAVYSDDKGATWSTGVTIPRGTNTYFDAYGHIISTDDGQLLASWYGNDGTNYTSYVIKSADNGATWGAAVAAATSTTVLYTETCFTSLGGNRVLGLARANTATTGHRQLYSADNGATWVDQGNVTFDPGATAGQNGCWITTYLGIDGERMVDCAYVDSLSANVYRVQGTAAALAGGPTGWLGQGNDGVLGENLSTGSSGSYPSVVHPDLAPFGMVAFSKEITTTSAINYASVFGTSAAQQPVAFLGKIGGAANGPTGIIISSTGVIVATKAGSPEGAVQAAIGSMFVPLDGGAGFGSLYIKENGTGTTGWRVVGSDMPISTKTANYSAGTGVAMAQDYCLLFNGTTLTCTLPVPSSVIRGKVFVVKNINASALTVSPGGGTIDGAASDSLAQWAVGRYINDGTNWFKI